MELTEEQVRQLNTLIGKSMTTLELDSIMRRILNGSNDMFDTGIEYWDNFTWQYGDADDDTSVNVLFGVLPSDLLKFKNEEIELTKLTVVIAGWDIN